MVAWGLLLETLPHTSRFQVSNDSQAIIVAILLRDGRHFVACRTAAWIAPAGILTYTAFVGAEAAIIRAAA